MVIDTALAIDAAAILVSAGALIAGITPPSIATSAERKRASNDFISRFGLASVYSVYAVQAVIVALNAAQIMALYRASSSVTVTAAAVAKTTSPWSFLQRINASKAAAPMIAQSATSVAVQKWLLHPALRRSFRIGCAIGTLGGILRVVCFRTLGRFFTFDLAVRKDHKVIQSGPYAFVRHPSYTAMLTMCGGMSYAHLAFGPLVEAYYSRQSALYFVTAGVALVATLVGLRIRDEERMLVRELGNDYKQYMTKVRSRLIPGVF